MRVAGGGVFTALLIVAVLLFAKRDKPEPSVPTVEFEGLSEVSPTPNPKPSSITMLPVSETAATLNSPHATVQDDLSTLDFVLSQYRRFSGGESCGVE